MWEGDYKIDRTVYEEAARRWGDCTLDAFASVATACASRFWTVREKKEAEGTNAFQQEWRHGERIWAHPVCGRSNDQRFELSRTHCSNAQPMTSRGPITGLRL